MVSFVISEIITFLYTLNPLEAFEDLFNLASAILTLALSKGYDNFFKKEIDSISIENTKTYLTKFLNDATAFLFTQQMNEQAVVVKKLEKKLKSQSKIEEAHTKDKSKIESKINSNKLDIVAFKITPNKSYSIRSMFPFLYQPFCLPA